MHPPHLLTPFLLWARLALCKPAGQGDGRPAQRSGEAARSERMPTAPKTADIYIAADLDKMDLPVSIVVDDPGTRYWKVSIEDRGEFSRPIWMPVWRRVTYQHTGSPNYGTAQPYNEILMKLPTDPEIGPFQLAGVISILEDSALLPIARLGDPDDVKLRMRGANSWDWLDNVLKEMVRKKMVTEACMEVVAAFRREARNEQAAKSETHHTRKAQMAAEGTSTRPSPDTSSEVDLYQPLLNRDQ